MSKLASAITEDIERQYAAIRARHSVRIIASEQEGLPIDAVPDNVFGYTFSPLNESTPLFAKRIYQAFEVHKLTNGVAHVLGFVTADEAAVIAKGAAEMDLKLYPEPRDTAATLVEIPFERIARARMLSRTEGNYLPLHLDVA